MRVLAVNKFYFLKGGSERYLFELKAVLESRGHVVVPFAMAHPLNVASPYAAHFVSTVDFRGPAGPLARLRAAARVIHSTEARRRMRQLLAEARPTVAHLHNVAHQLSPSILAPLKDQGVPVVHTLHDYKLVCPTYRLFRQGRVCERCLGGRFHHATLTRCNGGSLWSSAVNTVEMTLHGWLGTYRRHVDVYVAPSRFMRDKVIEGGVPAERVVVLPYCLDLGRYQPVYAPGDYVLFAGRLAEEKGVDVLLEAMRQLGGVELRIAGDGPLRGALERQAAGIRGLRVQFLGHREGEDLRRLMAGSRVVVVPSVWYENSPLVIYEAYALGKPVVGSRIGGIPELVAAGETGDLAEAGSAEDLGRALRDLWSRADLAEMGREARRRAEASLSPERHYEEIIAIYRRAGACE